MGASAGLASAHVPTNTGTEGCTPGFWKNNLITWESTAPNVYDPNTTLGSVFMNVPSALQGDSLLEALNYQGNLGSEARLLRQAVAALLNTVHFDVDYHYGDETALINAVNTALAGSASAENTLKNQLDTWNNGGCPLSANVDY